jgi:hypothetical protein
MALPPSVRAQMPGKTVIVDDHRQQDKFAAQCSCGYIPPGKSEKKDLISHINKFHKKNGYYICPISRCAEITLSLRKFLAHKVIHLNLIADIEKADGIFRHCPCGYKAPDNARQSRLRSLVENNLKMQNKLVCLQCRRTFVSWELFIDHIPEHALEKPFRCFDCNALFFRRKSLNEHEYFVHMNKNGALSKAGQIEGYEIEIIIDDNDNEKKSACSKRKRREASANNDDLLDLPEELRLPNQVLDENDEIIIEQDDLHQLLYLTDEKNDQYLLDVIINKT